PWSLEHQRRSHALAHGDREGVAAACGARATASEPACALEKGHFGAESEETVLRRPDESLGCDFTALLRNLDFGYGSRRLMTSRRRHFCRRSLRRKCRSIRVECCSWVRRESGELD